jgi:hypothetical protein
VGSCRSQHSDEVITVVQIIQILFDRLPQLIKVLKLSLL